MKIRTVRYVAKEGIISVYRNKRMLLASVSIVTASLVIFGIFLLITINLSQNTKFLKEQSEIQVYCYPEADDLQIEQVEQAIKSNDKIKEYNKVTKLEALKKVQDLLGDNQKLLEGEDESFLPVSFMIKLSDPGDSVAIVEQFERISSVEKVSYPRGFIELISKISHWVKVISVFLILVILAVSILIISNTIKLTVFARRKEISIMKYIGATDWFIRWPFIVEGITIGFIGAIIAFVLVSYGYNLIENRFNSDLMSVKNSFNFDTTYYFFSSFTGVVKMSKLGFLIIGVYSLIGVSIGALGSIVSIRKYLHV